MKTEFQKSLALVQANSKQREYTKNMYRRQWERFAEWCEAEGHNPLPPKATVMGAYLRSMEATGVKAGSINLAASAFGWQIKCLTKVPMEDRPASLKRFKKEDSPMEDIREIAQNIISEMEQVPPKRARGITIQELAQIFREDSKPRMYGTRQEAREVARVRAKTNKALFLTMYCGLLRSQEAVNIQWRDITTLDDGGGSLHVRKSKTSGKRRTQSRYLTPECMEALDAIRPKGGYDPEDFVFTERTKNGQVQPISRRTVTKRIKQACRHAKIKGWYEFSSHSMRVGQCQNLYAQKCSIAQIACSGDWSTTGTILAYVSDGNPEQSVVRQCMPDRVDRIAA